MNKIFLSLLFGLIATITANADSSVTVSVTNDFADSLAGDIQTCFASQDLFDFGTCTRVRHGTVSHNYKSGPKSISYKLFVTHQPAPNFDHCPELNHSDFSQTFYFGDTSFVWYMPYFPTLGKQMNLLVKIDQNYNVYCTLSNGVIN